MKFIMVSLYIAGVFCYFNSTCMFILPDNEIYDLNKFQLNALRDYTYKDDGILYVINFCRPAIKICNGVSGAFASLWNMSNFQCIQTLAEGDPITRYIDSEVTSRGIIIEYNGQSTAQIEIECDRIFDNPKLIRAGIISYSPDVYKFWFKSRDVCRNATQIVNEKSGLITYVVVLFLSGMICILIGVCMYYNESDYISAPCKEFWLSIILKAKGMLNKVVKYKQTDSCEI